MPLIAIDVVIEPDAMTMRTARALNARLRADYPAGFALDSDHTPHISLVHRYIHTADLDAVTATVSKLSGALPLSLRAVGLHWSAFAGVGILSLDIGLTPALRALASEVQQAVQPFAAHGGTAEAFAAVAGERINRTTITYVENFIPNASGANYTPHITIGIAQPAFLEALAAEPFAPVAVTGADIAIYQLGNFGTAQRRLWPSR